MTGINLYDERAVIIGTDTGVSFLAAPGDVAGYVSRFRHLHDLAVFGEAATTEADRIAREYRSLVI